ncbi:hypothetical protein [Roseateles amylovorans]|uniref:Uncharacterized protein n=1 Tax=Roseateles amylovorans TaxID=2978473 RepID=A0ABY6B8A4_9BURK|nr:hypothetical protein [Roseateles amylovorans]UXH79790.1 hypothetical protein N4261_07830 [Roseateles amylovorans]
MSPLSRISLSTALLALLSTFAPKQTALAAEQQATRSRATHPSAAEQVADKATGRRISANAYESKLNALGNGFQNLCENLSSNTSALIGATGFRILHIHAAPTLPARGYASAIDFYAAFSAGKLKVASAVEAIQIAIASEDLPISLEYQDAKGQWKRSQFDRTTGQTTVSDLSESTASHGIIFTQVLTNLERDFAIYGVEMSVIDLGTQEVVARNIGFARDVQFGIDVGRSLIPAPQRCGDTDEVNFVGSWILSLVRPYPAGSPDPYDPSRTRPVISDMQRHWATPKRR